MAVSLTILVETASEKKKNGTMGELTSGVCRSGSGDGDGSTLTPMIIHQHPLTPLQAAQAMQAAQLNLALQNLGGLNAANLPLLQQLSVVARVCCNCSVAD
jgi:hypothetical protein